MRFPNALKVSVGMVLVAAAACVESPQAGQERPGGGPAGDPDLFFLVQAALLNVGEVEAGRVAAERAVSPEVKEFARRMIEEHTKAQRDLTELAGKKGVEVPSKPDEAHAMLVSHLSKLEGRRFDAEYLALMTAAHARAVSLFESKVRLARDPEIRAWAERTLPALREHWRMARDLAGKAAGAGER
ncbi:MAG TPA: DUF4142 domain-containing protein [Planctomycetota bacterium]|nr:DUF4142 domain-containing protein [Planctomycetota bacterium]